MLQITRVVEQCCSFLQGSLSTGRALRTLGLAERHSLPNLLTSVLDYVSQNFRQVVTEAPQDVLGTLSGPSVTSIVKAAGTEMRRGTAVFDFLARVQRHRDGFDCSTALEAAMEMTPLEACSGLQLAALSEHPLLRDRPEFLRAIIRVMATDHNAQEDMLIKLSPYLDAKLCTPTAVEKVCWRIPDVSSFNPSESRVSPFFRLRICNWTYFMVLRFSASRSTFHLLV